ncbi:MAG TPA: sigma 54-interacting transcriptional regulator [Thermoanaerobaculia bacterium]|nr:sigma 54-interacting transcriptional regulator [Thermoanaerobaculia bacterium]
MVRGLPATRHRGTFQRIGDTAGRRFQGKLVAATNRDLAAEMREGRMRADLYYRLCSDRIETPSLREQLAEPEELGRVVWAVAARLVGREEAASLAEEVLERIRADLGDAYPWPSETAAVTVRRDGAADRQAIGARLLLTDGPGRRSLGSAAPAALSREEVRDQRWPHHARLYFDQPALAIQCADTVVGAEVEQEAVLAELLPSHGVPTSGNAHSTCAAPRQRERVADLGGTAHRHHLAHSHALELRVDVEDLDAGSRR